MTAGPAAILGSLTLFHYRAEGGSVVGVYPVIGNKAIKFLDLSPANTTCPAGTAVTCTVAGTSAANGSNDSWGPAGVSGSGVANSAPNAAPDLGVSDLEMDAFVGNNSPYVAPPPAGYAPGTFGPAQTQAALAAFPHHVLFQQTFGIVVNNGITQTNLSKQAVANILNGNYVDWSSVPDANVATPGATVKAASTPIFVCNREVGSGTRTSAAIFFLGDHCTPGSASISEGATSVAPVVNDNYSTSEALTCVKGNGAANGAGVPAGNLAITYASVDNNTAAKLGGLAHFVSIDGVAPTNYNTAIGAYGYTFEATGQVNASSGNAAGIAVGNALISGVQPVASAPQSLQVNAIPGTGGNSATNAPLTAVGATPIYISDFYRSGTTGNSCAALTEAN